MSMKIQESLAVMTVLAVLVGTPWVIWAYESSRVQDHGPEAQVITLTGISEGGVWTIDTVGGHNYWREDVNNGVSEIVVDPDRPVVLRVRSADVLHSFSIPALRIRPIDVYPGKEIIVRLEPEDMEGWDELGFLCYQFCGTDHEHMSGALIIDAAETVTTVDSPGDRSPARPGEGR